MLARQTGTIEEINIYPVKSLKGISLSQSVVTPLGLKWDRFWMIVNEDGLFMSQRNIPAMATISTTLTDSHLVLSHDQFGECHIPLLYAGSDELDATSFNAKVWQSECVVLDEGDKIGSWLTSILGRFRGQALRLVRLNPESQRAVSNKHTNGDIHQTYFADGYPFLVATSASLDELNTKLVAQSESAVPMSRFRANVVIAGTTAFVEHQFKYMQMGEAGTLHLCKPCERCKMTSIDQNSGEISNSKQPLKTLFSMENIADKGAYFGHNGVLIKSKSLENDCCISVGDTVCFSHEVQG
ncbi:MOSC N-terminal beta barrel domain-containing protein [Psychrosphaera sp. B3R10]|uniref:MOSC domain-containing protein n=1 Tax=unclassified Psychrosphaera TaxID=2641570 RepID=UPI001C09ECD9|nr:MULTISPECIES: MOSC N-terminal beta barrel domain-containing protein [unclassified Psychrosphaera]MBU2883095.1 MOSC N-terminal beta barrel domain-containing protein [Psychrosphaera sp. I2R16]MBU2988552.1 MOSC N-terminal beta barrel domain-containing protein [Psychrosphaera sp. B3R10]